MRNDACPLFCVYTLLQLWFILNDWDPEGPRQDLYFFPKKASLLRGNFNSNISYGVFDTAIKNALNRAGVLGNTDLEKVGPQATYREVKGHYFRCTGDEGMNILT
jgi:ABC-type multidrug transport system fused ATPase/permease subunit